MNKTPKKKRTTKGDRNLNKIEKCSPDSSRKQRTPKKTVSPTKKTKKIPYKTREQVQFSI